MAKIHVWLEEPTRFPGRVLVQSLFPGNIVCRAAGGVNNDMSNTFGNESYHELKTHICACGQGLCYRTNMWKLRKYQDEYRFIIESVLGLWFDNNEPIENCEIIMEIPGD